MGGTFQTIHNSSAKMAISVERIRREITDGRERGVIHQAIIHQNRIRFHAQTELSAYILQPTSDFLAFVSNLIPHDKFKVFQSLFRYPVYTNEVTGICFDKLARIFDGRNPVFDYQFTSADEQADWEEYRKAHLKEPEIWSTKGWEFFQTEINSVLIVDLPEDQDGDRPEPYFYWLPIADVITFEANPTTGQMEWIAFRQHDDRIAVMDDETFRVFRRDKTDNVGELLMERSHDIGYCPARFFWDEPISLRNPHVKRSPLTRQLDNLDWLLFYHISKKHLDLYGSYPIYSGYEQACDFSNAENGDYCDGGYIRDRQGHYKFDDAGLLQRCPKCGNKRIVGAGSFVEVPIPKDGQPDLRNPVSILTVDRDSLDYNVDEEERLRTNIITAVVGTNEEITTRDALNEQQIRANFESQTSILNRVKRGFESAQKWVDETICRLRYGDDYLGADINYGTEFYIYDAAELRERYRKAKEAGANEAELDALQDRIIDTEYRNNPAQRQRMMVLADLEPYRHLTNEEVVNLYKQGIASETDMRTKLNFSAYIRRFERENIDVVAFGSEIPYANKISNISSKLAEYARSNN